MNDFLKLHITGSSSYGDWEDNLVGCHVLQKALQVIAELKK